MAVDARKANILLTLATRSSPVLLRLDRPTCTGYDNMAHSHMVAARWNELVGVWEIQDSDESWLPIVPDARQGILTSKHFQLSLWRLFGISTSVSVYEFVEVNSVAGEGKISDAREVFSNSKYGDMRAVFSSDNMMEESCESVLPLADADASGILNANVDSSPLPPPFTDVREYVKCEISNYEVASEAALVASRFTERNNEREYVTEPMYARVTEADKGTLMK